MTFSKFFLVHVLLIQLILPAFPVSAQAQTKAQKSEKPRGLQFRLREGRPNKELSPAPPSTAPLTDEATQTLLSRLQPIKTENDSEQEFAFRDHSLPPPQTGKIISENFPNNVVADAPVATNAPLEIVRVVPEGEIPLAPHLSVTFSQPMIAVTSQSEATQNVPVKLSPAVKGKWRWLGTKTILFEPENRFPMATDFVVEIPAGTKSALGNTLATTKNFTFSTPPPTVKAFVPQGESIARDPLFFAVFDQRVDPATVLQKIKLSGNNKNYKLRLATPAEIQKDEDIAAQSKAANKDYWLAFHAEDSDVKQPSPLPVATKFQVSFESRLPSAEGTRTTTKLQNFSFSTYGAFQVKNYGCEDFKKRCEPNADSPAIEFTNELDEESFDEKQVRVEPAIPNLKIESYGQTISLEGNLKPLTTYKIFLAPTIKDEFGQMLGATSPLVFRTTKSAPNFGGPNQELMTLDPYGPRAISYYSINQPSLRVILYAVTPEDFPRYLDYRANHNRSIKILPPGRRIFSRVIPIHAKPEEMIETRIDLLPALKNGFGHVIAIVEPTLRNPDYDDSACAWIQSTNIGIDALADNADLFAWATSLRDGTPISDANFSLMSANKITVSGTTKTNGVAQITLPDLSDKASQILLARHGDDSALLPENYYANWRQKFSYDELRWHLLDDRAMYRPGEEIHFKGWLRKIGSFKNGDVESISTLTTKISYVIEDSRNNSFAKGIIELNEFGGFDLTAKIPEDINLGTAEILLTAEGQNISTLTKQKAAHRFQIQEFRRPEYEVTAQASAAPHFVGGNANITVNAAYYAGGGLPNADTTWHVTATPTNFTPPNRDEFTFGKWKPWWGYNSTYEEESSQNFAARTDATGKHNLQIDFDSADAPRPFSVKAEAAVVDVNRQRWNAASTILVHPSDLYVGIRTDRTFVEQGAALTGQIIAADIDGKAIAKRAIKLRAALLDSTYKKGEWVEEEKDVQEFTLQSGAEAIPFRIAAKSGGTYRITASIRDDKNRLNESEITMWVAGGKMLPSSNEVEQEKITLIPNKREFHVGDIAEILVQAPFYPAEAMLTLQRSGVVATERFTITSSSHTLKIPIKEEWTPNIHVQVDLVGATVRNNEKDLPDKSLPKRPAYASGEINLEIPPLLRKLNVIATPRHKAMEPGSETTVDVEVKDAAGKAVTNGEITLIVVDEAILALSDYKLNDPLATFYTLRDGGVNSQNSREQLFLANDQELKRETKLRSRSRNSAALFAPPPPPKPTPAAKGAPPQMTMTPQVVMRKDKSAVMALHEMGISGKGIAGGVPGGGGIPGVLANEPIKARVNFNPLAAFVASVQLDANSKAALKIKLPDNLTRYCVMALATDGAKKFGIHESAITARMPLMIRPSAPRFLNFGDQFELPVVLQNQTDEPMTVDVAVRAINAQFVLSTDLSRQINQTPPEGGTLNVGQRVTIPANDRVEVRFPATTVKPGKAHFQIAAAATTKPPEGGTLNGYADAAEISLPVWTPATTEAFATYGEIDAGAIVQPIKAPTDAIKQFGGLEITTSSTQLQALTDAVLYLTNYPYECAEQVSSRILAVAALRDVLSAFKAEGLPSPEELQSAVARDLKKLESMQNSDGGFSFWERNEKSWPYLSIHAAHALQRAKEKDFAVPEKMLANAQKYLVAIDSRIPSDYPVEARRTLIAYALYVRHRLGDNDIARAKKLIAEAGLDNLSLESLGWLLPILSSSKIAQTEVASIRQRINNRVEETAGAAHFTTSYKDGAHLLLASNRRTDGVLLEALIQDQPNSDLITKIVRGLLANRKQGHWANTQENAFILLALDKYFRTYENVTPDFVARVWLGENCANEQIFAGRSTDKHQLNVPMKLLSGEQNLTLNKTGEGRLYYRIGMQYAPQNFEQKAADYGFTVERTYEAIDDPNDVRRDEAGVWHIKAGASVRVRLTMVAPTRRYHVALVDPLPAGFEALNPALAVMGEMPKDQKEQPSKYWGWNRPWYEHQNLRDERVEAFTSLLWEGVYNYSYVARATTFGKFIVPPTKAEEMYQPETFGRSAGDKVIVE